MMRWLSRWSGRGREIGQRGYAICTAPRSGSNLLCQFLSSTRRLGRPLEYFNGGGRRAIETPDYPDDRRAQIHWILTKGATPNGVYGLKLFYYNHEAVSTELDWTEALPRLVYIYLERRDRLGQAISWSRALQTGQFRSAQPGQGPASYDGGAIRERLAAIDREYSCWAEFFRVRQLEPVRLAYEDLIDNPQAAIDRVAARFELAGRAVVDEGAIDLKIQRDAASMEWRTRYLSENGEPPVP